MKTKKFTILHSNDMHGDFLEEVRSGKTEMIGGLALLSGYINKVRAVEENVLYVISGDMVQGSMIDSEFKGTSTIEIMNFLAPDVVTLGNHEFDYGLPHLLFLEKMANFPIVNANLYIKKYNKRLMQPYVVIKKAGFEILFTGIITDKVIDSIKSDKVIGSFISLEDAAAEVGKITNAYKSNDIDLTVLLTHIGFESDLELAKMLDPEWGVDMIIGGHSHTILDKPEEVNNVLIAQAGTGTDQIGRFDITVDDKTNSIIDYQWHLIPIVEGIAEPDQQLKDFIAIFKKQVDDKYNTILTKFSEKLTHPKREIETALGNALADGIADIAECDVELLGSGSVRVKELGPVVTLGDFMSCFPYDDSLTRFKITGTQLKNIFNHIMRISNRDGEGENYQVNKGVVAIYSNNEQKLLSLKVNSLEVVDDQIYTICLQGYHYNNCADYLNITSEELVAIEPPKVISTSAQGILQEYLRNNQNIVSRVEGRLQYIS